MAINFPDTPTINETYTAEDRTWEWNGSTWNLIDGTDPSNLLPSQTGNAGKYLFTDGTQASWSVLDLSAKQDVVSGVDSTEIGYLNGVTSNIQLQLDGKASTSHTHLLASITDITATATEVNYLSGVTSSIQSQINSKASSSHTHAISEITSLQSSLDGKANLSGASFTGNLSITTNAPIIEMTESDTSQKFFLVVDGSTFSIRPSSTANFGFFNMNSAGKVYKIVDSDMTAQFRNIVISTADPSGGNVGDVWIKYVAA